MSQKNVKAVKRETRRMMKWYLTEFQEYLRPKPRWMPWAVWEWMQKKVLHIEKIRPGMIAKRKVLK